MQKVITNYHDFLAASINHPKTIYCYSQKRDAIVEANWGQRLVMALHPKKRLESDLTLIEKVIELRSLAKEGSPFKLLGRASYAFNSPVLAKLENQIKCVEQGCVVNSRSMRSSFGEQKFLFEFGQIASYCEWDDWRNAADLFYPKSMAIKQVQINGKQATLFDA